MKKICMALLCLLPLSSFAQKGFTLNLNTAVNSTWIVEQQIWLQDPGTLLGGVTKEMSDYDKTFGMAFGGGIGYNFNDHFGLRVEFQTAKIGQNYVDQAQDLTREVGLRYTQIPVLLHFSPGSEDAKSQFFLNMGVQFSSLKSATDLVYTTSNTTNILLNRDVTERFTANDMQGVFELGLQIEAAENFFISPGLRANATLKKDINHADWQHVNNDGVYDPSRHVYGGLNLTLTYVISTKGAKTVE